MLTVADNVTTRDISSLRGEVAHIDDFELIVFHLPAADGSPEFFDWDVLGVPQRVPLPAKPPRLRAVRAPLSRDFLPAIRFGRNEL